MLDGNALCDVADLYSCPADVEVSGFQGNVRLPGHVFWQDFYSTPWWTHPLVAASTLLASLLASPRVSRVVGEGWRRKVQAGAAVLCASAGYKAAMVMPRALGGVTTFFWVPVAGVGTGTWDGTTDAAHWATTSGGTGGLSGSPTSVDTVTFDSNSGTAATVTIATGAAASAITVNKADLVLTYSVGLTITGTMTLTTGTLNTTGKTCSWGALGTSGSSASATMTLGASAITLTGSGPLFLDNTNMTMTANTATVTCTASGVNPIRIANLNTNGLSVVCNGGGSPIVNVLGTVANLTITGTAVKTDDTRIQGSCTITGTLTLGGGSTQGANRLLVKPDTIGATRTFSMAGGAVVINGDVDFQDIAITGSPSWANAGSAFVGDALGNSSLIVTNRTAPATQTFVGGTASWSAPASWTSRAPLPQDDVVVNTTTAGTLTADMPRLGCNIDFTSFTRTLALSAGTTSTLGAVHGSLTFSTTMTVTGANQAMSLAGRGSFTLTTGGLTLPNLQFGVNAFGGTYTQSGNLAFSGGGATMSITAGTYNDGGNNVNANKVAFSGSIARALVITGTWSLAVTGSSTVWDATGSNRTLTATGTVQITSTDSAVTKTFAGGGLTYGTFKHASAGSASLTITGNNTFTNFDVECTTARTVTYPASGTQTITGTLTFTGAAGNNISLVSSSPGTATTITLLTGTQWAFSGMVASADVTINLPFRANIAGPPLEIGR